MNEHKAPVLEHLGDLRWNLIRAGLGFFSCVIISYFFCGRLLELLRQPMEKILPEGFSFVVLSPQEYFFCELKISLLAGLILSSPWVLYQIWLFISPGLYLSEKKLILIFLFISSICFIFGVIFAYLFVFPPMFRFFISTLPSNITGMYSVGMLYGLGISIILAFGAVFQTPIIVFLLVLCNLLDLNQIIKSRSYVFVGAFIIGAILTPPDPVTQILLALPMYALFELGILFVRLFQKSKN